MPEILRERGAKEVVVAPAYRTIKPKGAQVVRVRELMAAGKIDLVTFTSSSTVTNFCEMIGGSGKGIRAAAIGPITAATAEERGFEVVVRPREYTIDALTEAIREHFVAGKMKELSLLSGAAGFRTLTSPCPRSGRREPKASDGRGATPAVAITLVYYLLQVRKVVLLSDGGRVSRSGD